MDRKDESTIRTERPSQRPGRHPGAHQQPEESQTSVVVVSYRTGPVLLDCLNAILAQPGLAELVLVDNGNDAAQRAQIAALSRREARLIVLDGHGNIGFAAACNLGAAQASGRYLLLLNPDCIIGPDTLLRAMAVFERDPGATLLGARLQRPDGTDQRGSRRNLPTPWICLVESLRLDRLAPNHPHFVRLNLHERAPPPGVSAVQCISGAFMMMRRVDYAALGGLDTGYFLHVEDIDLCMRVAQVQGRVLFAADIVAVHLGGTSRALPLFTEWHKAKGFIRYFRKHFRTTYAEPLLSLISAAVFVRMVLRSPALTVRWLADRLGQERGRGTASSKAHQAGV
jgi:hypothetical protein